MSRVDSEPASSSPRAYPMPSGVNVPLIRQAGNTGGRFFPRFGGRPLGFFAARSLRVFAESGMKVANSKNLYHCDVCGACVGKGGHILFCDFLAEIFQNHPLIR